MEFARLFPGSLYGKVDSSWKVYEKQSTPCQVGMSLHILQVLFSLLLEGPTIREGLQMQLSTGATAIVRG
jgi:hypothetical protein